MSSSDTAAQTRPVWLDHPDGRLRIRFQWSGDRFTHHVQFAERAIDSVEPADGGDPDGGGSAQCDADEPSSWPRTPPIQQLSIEPINDALVALGVGIAGTSHWSVSVEPCEAGFVFDWACRTKTPPGFLGSTYLPHPAFEILGDEMSQVRRDTSCCEIVPAEQPPQAGTFRWRYSIVLKG